MGFSTDVIYGESYPSVNALGSTSGAKTINLTSGTIASITVTGSTTFTFSGAPASGKYGVFRLIITNGGSHAVIFPSTVLWSGGAVPTLTATGTDVVEFYTIDGGTNWYGTLIAGDVKSAYDTLIMLLVHSNTTNDSTTFTDSSTYARTITANGQIKHSTTQKKFGATSIYCDGDGDYLSLEDNDAWSFGTGDFTLEGWFYHTSLATQIEHFSQPMDGSGNFWDLMWSGNIFKFRTYTSSSPAIDLAWDYTLSTNTWYHVALVRNGNNFYLFINGVNQGTKSESRSVPNVTTTFRIGGGHSSIPNYALTGYMDEIRVSKGIARWTANFTPPTSAY